MGAQERTTRASVRRLRRVLLASLGEGTFGEACGRLKRVDEDDDDEALAAELQVAAAATAPSALSALA
eukprot:6692361-Prymnesium_polylepis.1